MQMSNNLTFNLLSLRISHLSSSDAIGYSKQGGAEGRKKSVSDDFALS